MKNISLFVFLFSFWSSSTFSQSNNDFLITKNLSEFLGDYSGLSYSTESYSEAEIATDSLASLGHEVFYCGGYSLSSSYSGGIEEDLNKAVTYVPPSSQNYILFYFNINNTKPQLLTRIANSSFSKEDEEYISELINYELEIALQDKGFDVIDPIAFGEWVYFNYLKGEHTSDIVDLDAEQKSNVEILDKNFRTKRDGYFLSLSGVPIHLPVESKPKFVRGDCNCKTKTQSVFLGNFRGMIAAFESNGRWYRAQCDPKQPSKFLGYFAKDNSVGGRAKKTLYTGNYLPSTIEELIIGEENECLLTLREVKYETKIDLGDNAESTIGNFMDQSYWENVVAQKVTRLVLTEPGKYYQYEEYDSTSTAYYKLNCNLQKLSPHLKNDILTKGSYIVELTDTTNVGAMVLRHNGSIYSCVEDGEGGFDYYIYDSYKGWLILGFDNNHFINEVMNPAMEIAKDATLLVGGLIVGAASGGIGSAILVYAGSGASGIALAAAATTSIDAAFELGLYAVTGDADALTIGLVSIGAGTTLGAFADVAKRLSKAAKANRRTVNEIGSELESAAAARKIKGDEAGILYKNKKYTFDEAADEVLSRCSTAGISDCSKLAGDLNDSPELLLFLMLDDDGKRIKTWNALIEADNWARLNTVLLGKIANETEDVIKNAGDFYSKTMKNRTPYNFQGQGIYNKGVEYNEFGFPKLREENPLGEDYVFKLADGNHTTDFNKANKWLSDNKEQLGYEEVWFKPNSTTFKVKKNGNWSDLLSWHHHENGNDMIPVPTELHTGLPHVGGVETVKQKINHLFNY